MYNFLSMMGEQGFVSQKLDGFTYTLGMELITESAGKCGESLVWMKLYASDTIAAEGQKKRQSGKFTPAGDGLFADFTSGDAMTEQHDSPGACKCGTILFDGVTVEKSRSVDLQVEQHRAPLNGN